MNQIHELCAIFTCISNSCENTKGKYLNSLPTTVMEVSFVLTGACAVIAIRWEGHNFSRQVVTMVSSEKYILLPEQKKGHLFTLT
jgi:hypothetical protein